MAEAYSPMRDDCWDQWGILLDGPPGRQAILTDIPDEMITNGLGSAEAMPIGGDSRTGYTRMLWIVSHVDLALHAADMYDGPPPDQRPSAMPLEAAWQEAAECRIYRELVRAALANRLRGNLFLSETIVLFAS